MTRCRQPPLAQVFFRVAPRGALVFKCEQDEYAVFYAPRQACVLPRSLAPDAENQLGRLSSAERSGALESVPSREMAGRAASRLVQAAQDARNEAAAWAQAAFSPECLTLFLNNACNLRCRYCHAAPGAAPDRPISDRAIRAAGETVALSCAQRRRPLTVAFHGGGEPTLDESRANHILEIVQAAAHSCGVPLQTYIATNGVMPEDRARWLASRFDLVGLSCDGPPEVQDRQRPARDGRPTSSRVGRTAEILREAGRTFHIRATITRETLCRQAEIAAYFMVQFAPAEIRLEPVYANPDRSTELGPEAASLFVAGFMAARKAAAAQQVPVTTSLTRPGSLYGRYCHALRHVLNLVPGDIATGCFLESREAGILRRQVRVGAMRPASACFELDQDRLDFLVSRCSEIPDCCRDCLCCFQCTHGCPDLCPLETPVSPARQRDLTVGFRCRAHRLLMEALILEAADTAWRSTPPGVSQEVWVPATRLRVAVYRGAGTGGASP